MKISKRYGFNNLKNIKKIIDKILNLYMGIMVFAVLTKNTKFEVGILSEHILEIIHTFLIVALLVVIMDIYIFIHNKYN